MKQGKTENIDEKSIHPEESRLAIFQGKEVRRVIYQNEWWFSVLDVVRALTNSERPNVYWSAMKARVKNEEQFQLSTICKQLKLTALDNKQRETDCANTEGIFRIIQSIPSPKAEPFKRWLARVGYERVKEIEDPELGTKRTRTLYRLKGYSDSWIEKRLRGINVRENLTEEWQKRDIKSQREFAILTAEISKATFDMTPSEYKKFKNLERENLRDHMDDLELIFSMLGEASTTRITEAKDAYGFIENREAAIQGGSIAGKARKKLEAVSNKKVSTNKNYLKNPQNKLLN